MKKIKMEQEKKKGFFKWTVTRWYFWGLIFLQFIWSNAQRADELGRVDGYLLIPIFLGAFINWLIIFLLILWIIYLYRKFKNRKKK